MSEFLVRDKRERAGRFIDDIARSTTQTTFLLDKMRQNTAISSSIRRSKQKLPGIHEKSVDQLRMTTNAGSVAGDSASLLKMKRLGTTDSINSVAFQKSMQASQTNFRHKKGLNPSGTFS